MPTAAVEEIVPKSVLNRVDSEYFPFRWTLNPYRGCQHSCVYCFARNTHTHLGYNSGDDFNNRVIVKQGAAQVLRRQMQRPGWRRELIMLGAAVDPWQPLEAKYRITRSLLRVIRDVGNPLGALTKSTLVTRDIDLLAELAQAAPVRIHFSVGTLDERVWRSAEPGTPHPLRRIEAMGALVRAGVPAGVMLAPIMPGLTDTEESIDGVVRAAAEHGAHFVVPIVLHLRPGTKEWFMPWLRHSFPALSGAYDRLYPGRHGYAPEGYQERVRERVQGALQRWRLAPPERPATPMLGQLALAM
jgi:DNA repair photolyase